LNWLQIFLAGQIAGKICNDLMQPWTHPWDSRSHENAHLDDGAIHQRRAKIYGRPRLT